MVPAAELSPGPAPRTPEALLRRLEWTVVRRLDGRLQGDYRTILRGIGVDLRDLREYEPGDDLRHIDWNVTARTDIPHVRQYAEDRELTAWLLLDRSASMGFGAEDRPKHDVVLELTTVLAHLLARGGNRVGAVLFSDGLEQVIPPRQGRTQVLRIGHALLADPTPTSRPTDLRELLRAAVGLARTRSLVVVISDFVSQPGWEQPLSLLAQRHDVVAVQVLDPIEHELPDSGLLAVADAETGDQVLVDTSDPVFRARLAELAAAQQQRLAETVGRAGLMLHTVSTRDDLVVALLRISARRVAAARRGGAGASR
jgi:uncharacterized protein (DUF58 family)